MAESYTVQYAKFLPRLYILIQKLVDLYDISYNRSVRTKENFNFQMFLKRLHLYYRAKSLNSHLKVLPSEVPGSNPAGGIHLGFYCGLYFNKLF